mmetsp:Transcript_15261/g.34619  ORF Transcript_15261/g.34619 Transcript_15261/m.34619 type:complete len:125 (+) Transcript_15261:73-447(+)
MATSLNFQKNSGNKNNRDKQHVLCWSTMRKDSSPVTNHVRWINQLHSSCVLCSRFAMPQGSSKVVEEQALGKDACFLSLNVRGAVFFVHPSDRRRVRSCRNPSQIPLLISFPPPPLLEALVSPS